MKAYFLSRSLREKLLVLLLAVVAAAVWATSAAGRLADRWRDWRSASAELAAQQLWLDNRPAIEERAARAARSLEPGRTLDATHLVSEVAALAAAAGLSPAIEPPATQRTPQFAYHTVQVTFRRVELAALVKFYRELDGRMPYLAIEQSTLAADRTNPAQLNATFVIFSVEVKRATGGPQAMHLPAMRKPG